MSAILEALKKLEQETSEPDGHPLRRAINRHGKRRRIFLAGALAAGIILCGFAGYGVVVLARKSPAPTSTIARRAGLPAGAELSVTLPTAPSLQPVRASVPAAMPPASRPAKKAPAPERKVVALSLEEGNPPAEASGETVSTASPLIRETVPEAKKYSVGATTFGETPGAVLEIINDPETVLQAISWSQDTARRLAVINGKICRETEQMNGYVILAINPEDVVVSKGSVTGRLVFKIR